MDINSFQTFLSDFVALKWTDVALKKSYPAVRESILRQYARVAASATTRNAKGIADPQGILMAVASGRLRDDLTTLVEYDKLALSAYSDVAYAATVFEMVKERSSAGELGLDDRGRDLIAEIIADEAGKVWEK
jgi:hypothetical protein